MRRVGYCWIAGGGSAAANTASAGSAAANTASAGSAAANTAGVDQPLLG